MYLLGKSVIEIIKIFLISAVCSTAFAFMIYRDSALPNAFICLVLNTSAFLLFLYISYINWSKMYENTYSPSEYYIPAAVSVLAYAAVSAFFYSQRFTFYMWFFLPTRFLEPKLNRDYAYLSVVAAYVITFALVFVTPAFANRRR